MGQRVVIDPDYFELGNACALCEGTTFPAGKTPKYVRCRFYDIIKCGSAPEPPNGYHFKCEQDGVWSCLWVGSRTINGISYTCTVDLLNGVVYLDPTGSGNYYFRGSYVPCQLVMSVNTTTCPPHFGTGGRAIIEFFTGLLDPVLNPDNAFVQSSQGLFDPFPADQAEGFARLVDRNGKTNALFSIDLT